MPRRLAWIWLLGGLSIAAVLYASSGLSAGHRLKVLGELRARGTVTLAPADGGTPLRISDSAYTYMAGDGLRTGEGTAALAFAKSDGLAFGPGTVATVDRAGGGVAVSLEAGAVAYAMHGDGDLHLEAGGLVATPVTGSLTAVSSEATAGEEPARAGLVSLGKNGHIHVYAYTGRLEVRRGDVAQVVEAGSQVSFGARRDEILSTRATWAEPGNSQGSLVWSLLLGALAGATGIAGAFVIMRVRGGTPKRS
jgi:hypothetical protein